MMNIETAYRHVERCGIMAGMRGAFPPETALAVCETLLKAGIHVFEFTYNSEKPVEAMKAVKSAFGDEVCAGMGTVLSLDVAKEVLDAGADFVVAPCFQPDVTAYVHGSGVLMGPGALTPTEIVAAWETGVRLIKLFPIGTLGIEHFKQIRGPLNHINFMCNGATSDQNVGEFIRAGAVACGLGGWLTGTGSMPLETIAHRAQTLRKLVDDARSP